MSHGQGGERKAKKEVRVTSASIQSPRGNNEDINGSSGVVMIMRASKWVD